MCRRSTIFHAISGKALIQIKANARYSSKGLSCTLTSGSGGFGGHSGLYLIEDTENFGLPIKSKTKDGYQIAYPGDSIDTAFSGQNSRPGRVGSQIAHTLTTSATQAVFYLLPERENDRISHRPLTQSVKPVGRNESNEMDTRVHFIDLNPQSEANRNRKVHNGKTRFGNQ